MSSRYIPAGKTTEQSEKKQSVHMTSKTVSRPVRKNAYLCLHCETFLFNVGYEAEQRRQRDGMSANGKQGSRCTSGACLPAHKCQQSRTDILDFDMAMFFTLFILRTILQCLRKSLNSVKTLVRHFKYLLASTPLIIRHARHFSFIWVMYHCKIFIFSSHLF
jgi:hypothetical protein